MFPAGFRRYRWGILAVLMTAPAGLASAYTASIIATPDARLQQIADDAALAGVNALAASVGLPEQSRIDAAVAATRAEAARAGRDLRGATASPEQLTFSVTVSDQGRRGEATATARYVAPSEGSSAQTSAALDTDAAVRDRM